MYMRMNMARGRRVIFCQGDILLSWRQDHRTKYVQFDDRRNIVVGHLQTGLPALT